jgi:hypothetical protein
MPKYRKVIHWPSPNDIRIWTQTFHTHILRPKISPQVRTTVPSSTSSYSFIPEQDRPQGEPAGIPGRPANQPHESILNLKFTELLSFFQQYQVNCPNLQMVCPWVGAPLPSIIILLELSLGWNAKLELSKELSSALMKYIRALRAAATKVSH